MKFFLAGMAAIVFAATAMAQSPRPVSAPANVVGETVPDAEVTANIKILEEMKAANNETLKKQQAALELLDELQKEADQLRVLSKRG